MISRILPRVSTAASRHMQSKNNIITNDVLQKIRSISITPLIQAQITVNVPTMGDSITEGTIVEWCVSPGSVVKEGDVLALVETDKVTVDIKAEQHGVLVKQLGEVDGVIEVGEGLYVLDTDVSSSAASASSSSSAADAVVENVSEVNASLDADKIVAAADNTTISSSARVPSIHFLGKEGWKKILTTTDESVTSSSSSSSSETTTTIPSSNKPNSPTSITHIPYSSMYGRPPITDEEMEALILGGAEEAPGVRSVTSEDGMSGFVFVGGKVVTAGPRGVWLAE